MKKTIRRFVINASVCLGLSVFAFGQNPFDIKTPDKKQAKPVLNNTSKESQTKPTESKVIDPPKPTQVEIKTIPSNANTPVNPQLNQPTSINTTSTSTDNPFEIKAGANPQSTNPQSANPFSIKAGSESNQPVNGNSGGAASIVTPDLKDLKNQIKELKTSTVQSQGHISKNTWFVIYIFLVLLAGIAINFNRSYPLALMKATYNQNQMRILFKDAFKGNHTFIFGILYFLFIVNAGIFLYQSFLIFNITKISLLFAIFIVFMTYLVRHFVLFVMGVIFPMTKEASLFSYTIGIYNLALGIALLFLNSALLFVDPETGKMLIFSGLSIIIVLYILRQVRGLLSNVPGIITSKFHFIIYLCTVEIAPWLLLSGILLK